MDKIEKFLRKLTKKERKIILTLLNKIAHLDLSNLDVKSLKGYAHMYRVRKGKIRILFFKDTKKKKGIITGISYRDKAYD